MLTYQRAGHALGITRTTIYLQEGLGIYEVDLEALQAAEPDLLLSQAICEVCAISSREVTECSLRWAKTPQILSLDPQYVGDVLNDIRRVAAATDTSARGEEIVASLQCRIAAVAERAAQATTRPRVLHLEWAEPVMCGGHWVPEMVEMAGGVNCFGDKETGSFRLDWDAVVESQPEMIILMLWAIRRSARWRMYPSWQRNQAGTTCQRYDITRFSP